MKRIMYKVYRDFVIKEYDNDIFVSISKDYRHIVLYHPNSLFQLENISLEELLRLIYSKQTLKIERLH